jgi:hypothetical protein
MDTWVRTVLGDLAWQSGHVQLAAVPRAYTLLRVHFQWGFEGYASALSEFGNSTMNVQVMGICTTVGTGTEAVPNARTQSGNQAPPTQRWIYWEARAPVVKTYSEAAELVTYSSSLAGEPTDTKAMVSAKTIPAGQTLNVWASWAAATAWDQTGSVHMWCYASLAYQPSV